MMDQKGVDDNGPKRCIANADLVGPMKGCMAAHKQDGEQMKIRLQAPIHEWLKGQAKAQERSMNWIVNKLLTDAKVREESRHANAA